MWMEQTTHAPGQLRRILPGVLLAAGLVWLMTGLFAPLTLGLLLAALMAPMAEALSRHTGCPRRLAAVGTMALFYLLLGLALTAAGSWAAGTGRTSPPAAAPAVEFLPASGSGTAPGTGWRSSPPGMPRSQRRWWTGLPPRWSAPCPAALGAFPAGLPV